MKKTALFATLTVAAFAGAAHADLIAGWNFNDTANLLTVSHGSGTMTTSFTGSGSVTNFAGSTVNAVTGDVAGQALALVNQSNNGQTLTIQVNLTGFENPIFTFAGQRTGTGFNSDQVAYSTNGTTFTNIGSPILLPASFGLQTIDFSSINAVDNAAAVYIRITFNGNSSASGNNRLDNVQVNATAVAPTPGAAALMGLGSLAACRRRRA